MLKPLVFVASLLPLMALALGLYFNTLGSNPVETLIRDSGEWGLRFLFITLAITPMRRLLGWSWGMRYRRMMGLFSFFYVSLHLSLYLWLDKFFYWDEIWFDVVDRPFITFGFIAYLILLALAVTSTHAMMRRLGRNWQRLHRWVYAGSLLALLHFIFLVKLDLTQPIIYGFILAFLLGSRLYFRLISTPVVRHGGRKAV